MSDFDFEAAAKVLAIVGLTLCVVIPFERKTYVAKLFQVPIGDGFHIAGTLDGLIDFAILPYGTYQLTLDEARALIAALRGSVLRQRNMGAGREALVHALHEHA